MSRPIPLLVAALFVAAPAFAGVVPPPTAPGVAAKPAPAVKPATAVKPPVLNAAAPTPAPTSLTVSNLQSKQQAMMVGNTRYAETLPNQTESRQQQRLAQEAAQVWAHHAQPTAQSMPLPSSAPAVSTKKLLEKEDARFHRDVQGRIYNVPAGRFYLTVVASQPIRQVVIPPDSHVARAKYLPRQHDEIMMLRFRRDAAYHPVQMTLSFPGGVRILYLLPKPMLVGRTIHVKAPHYVPKIPLHRNLSGNPYSRFLPAIRAVWTHARIIPGFQASTPPRHNLDYGRFALEPRYAWAGQSDTDWMILWKMVSLNGQVSNVSPAQFSGPQILAVSLTGTRVSATESPYLLTVEGAIHKGA